MDNPEIQIGKSLVQATLKESAVKLGLPKPVVNWQTQYVRGSTIYTAYIFFGEKQKRVTFFDQELRAWCENNQQPVMKNRIADVLTR